MPVSTTTIGGWMPDAVRRTVPASNYHIGHQGRLGVVLHIIEGSGASAISEFQRGGSQLSAHFVANFDGSISQLVSIHDTAYANGLSWDAARQCWIDPQGHVLLPPHTPPWSRLAPPINPNFQTISIEREGHYQDIPPAAQNAGVVKILRYCATEYPELSPYVFMESLIGHCHISPISKANCPGPHVNYEALTSAANTRNIYTVTAGKYGAIVQEDRRPDAPAAGYFPPSAVITCDDLTNMYHHTVSGLGFIPAGQVQP